MTRVRRNRQPRSGSSSQGTGGWGLQGAQTESGFPGELAQELGPGGRLRVALAEVRGSMQEGRFEGIQTRARSQRTQREADSLPQ